MREIGHKMFKSTLLTQHLIHQPSLECTHPLAITPCCVSGVFLGRSVYLTIFSPYIPAPLKMVIFHLTKVTRSENIGQKRIEEQ